MKKDENKINLLNVKGDLENLNDALKFNMEKMKDKINSKEENMESF